MTLRMLMVMRTKSEKPIFCTITFSWIKSKLDSLEHMEPLYPLGSNFILDIELTDSAIVNTDP